MFTGLIRSVRSNIGKIVVTAGAAATVGVGAMLPRPASADTESTAITAAAILTGIALIAGANEQPAYGPPPCGYYNDCPVYYGGGPAWRGPVYVNHGRNDVRSYGGDRRSASRDDRGRR